MLHNGKRFASFFLALLMMMNIIMPTSALGDPDGASGVVPPKAATGYTVSASFSDFFIGRGVVRIKNDRTCSCIILPIRKLPDGLHGALPFYRNMD